MDATMYRLGHRDRIMSTLFDFPLDIYAPGCGDRDWLAGWNECETRAANIAWMRDHDPLEFLRLYGAQPTNYGRCEAHANASADLAWRERCAALADLYTEYAHDAEDVRREMLLDEMRHDDASDPMTLAKAEDMHLEAGRERDHGVTL